MEETTAKKKTTRTITIGQETAGLLLALVEDANHEHAKTMRAQVEIAVGDAHNRMVRLREHRFRMLVGDKGA